MAEEKQGADTSTGANAADNSGASRETDEAVRMAAESVINRRSRWISSLAALRYVSSVSNDNEIKVRDSDRATTIALLVCCVAALSSLVIPQLEQHRHAFVLAADVLVGLALLMYVSNRFGIVTTFAPRQALLTWQLMLGSSLLGIFLTINLALIIVWAISQNHIILPMPH